MIISSFQAKTGGERPRNSKKKKLSFRSVPTQLVLKNSKKILEIKKHRYGFF